MKKRKMWMMITAFVAAFGLLIGGVMKNPITFAKDKEDFTLENMLTQAVQDEVNAKATYEAILAKFGENAVPYNRLARAENQHIARIAPLLDQNKVAMPKATAAKLPATLEETYEAMIKAEKENEAMYDKFLKQELPDNVKVTFEQLKNATGHHIQAITRAKDGQVPMHGKGMKNGKGNGMMGQDQGRGNMGQCLYQQ